MDKHFADRFSALGDPTRLAVVEVLLDGPATVSELAEPFPIQLPPFTKHSKVLEDAGLIKTEKHGRVRTCFINSHAMDELDQWFKRRRTRWEQRMDRLERHIENQSNSGSQSSE